MRTFREILEKSNIPELEVKDYDLSDKAKEENIPWMLDPKAKWDMGKRSIEAEKFWKENYNNEEVITSDGYKIYFTKKGREEFFSSIKSAFFIDNVNSAAKNKIKKNWPLANGLIHTIDILGDLVKKSSLEYEEPNYKKNTKLFVDHYETFLVPVKINGKEKKMKIKVEFRNTKDGGNKRIYYYHWLQEHKSPIIPIITEFCFLE
jgi:hypothetical protein